MNSLVDGALIIKVNMKMVSPSPFILQNPSACEVIQGQFMNVKSNDIVFEVGGEEQLKNGEEKTTSQHGTSNVSSSSMSWRLVRPHLLNCLNQMVTGHLQFLLIMYRPISFVSY